MMMTMMTTMIRMSVVTAVFTCPHNVISTPSHGGEEKKARVVVVLFPHSFLVYAGHGIMDVSGFVSGCVSWTDGYFS